MVMVVAGDIVEFEITGRWLGLLRFLDADWNYRYVAGDLPFDECFSKLRRRGRGLAVYSEKRDVFLPVRGGFQSGLGVEMGQAGVVASELSSDGGVASHVSGDRTTIV